MEIKELIFKWYSQDYIYLFNRENNGAPSWKISYSNLFEQILCNE